MVIVCSAVALFAVFLILTLCQRKFTEEDFVVVQDASITPGAVESDALENTLEVVNVAATGAAVVVVVVGATVVVVVVGATVVVVVGATVVVVVVVPGIDIAGEVE